MKGAPVAVVDVADATSIAVSDSATCAIVGGGRVKCWGGGSYGEAGEVDGEARRPVTMRGLHDVVELSMGGEFACARESDASVWCWGSDEQGQLGDGASSDGDRVALVDFAAR
jgi:alpha-tubulin suppressor-like RCC1 family protein